MATYMQAVNISHTQCGVAPYPGRAVDGRRRGRLDFHLLYRGECRHHADDALARGPLSAARPFFRSRSPSSRSALCLRHVRRRTLQFVAARIVQGAASGTLAPLCRWRSCSMMLPPSRHARIGLVWTVTSLLGILSGPGIGGWLSEYYGWHSLFYFSLPIAGFIFLTMALSPAEKKPDRARPSTSSGW